LLERRVETSAKGALAKAGVDLGRLDILRYATDRTWMRDIAPSFVKSGDEVAMFSPVVYADACKSAPSWRWRIESDVRGEFACGRRGSR
jgi:hypothetical protein